MSETNSKASSALRAGQSADPDGAVGATPRVSALDNPQRLTLSVEQVGRILGISRGAAYAYAKDGSIPTIRLGKRLLVSKAALDKLLSA
jgi:excisionase family DNA binding protein